MPRKKPNREKKAEDLQIPKRITRKWLERFDFGRVTDLTAEQAKRVIKSGYYQAKKSKKEFKKEKIISPAFESYYGKEEKFTIPQSASVQELWHEVWKSLKFVQAKTSTLEGAKQYWKEQNKRIFGEDKKQMSQKQSIRYWRAYNEFMHQHQEFMDNSDKVQQVLGQMSFWRRRNYTADDLMEVLDKLNEEIEDYDDFDEFEDF